MFFFFAIFAVHLRIRSRLENFRLQFSNTADYFNLFDKFSLFIFGSGLYRISKFYNTDIRKESERFTQDKESEKLVSVHIAGGFMYMHTFTCKDCGKYNMIL